VSPHFLVAANRKVDLGIFAVIALSVVKIRLLRKISNLQEPDFRSTESRKLGP